MKNIYRDVLKQAWDITKKNKILWFFGLFAALLGNGGEYQILIKVADQVGGGANNLVKSALSFSFGDVYRFLTYNPLEFALVLTAVFAILFLTGFLIWLVIVSQGALIKGASAASGKKKFDFREGIGAGMEKFAPLLGINVLSKVLIFSVLFGFGVPLLFSMLRINGIAGVLLYLLFFIILIPLAIIISFIAKFAAAFVVLKDKDFFSSIKNAFRLFCDNWVVSLEMALILFLLNAAVGLLFVFLIALIYMPLATMAFMYFVSGFWIGSWFTIILMAVLSFVLVGFAGAILACFQWASWVVLFKRLTSRETVLSKIERAVVGFPQWVKEHI